jgi:trigger factor
MRATANVLDNNKIKLVIEIDELEMADAVSATVKSIAQDIVIKGFRKGKAPRNLIEQRLGGAQALRAEAIREAMPDFYARAVVETEIDPIDQPNVTITAGEDEGVVVFEAEVEVRPEVSIGGYQNLVVTLPSVAVSADDVDDQLVSLRDTDAILNVVERSVVTTDVVTLDIVASDPTGESEPMNLSDIVYPVGSESITEGLDEQLIGKSVGDELQIAGPGPMGTGAWIFDVTVKEVKEKSLPELTDEWVAESTDFTTVEELRRDIETQLTRRKVLEAQFARRDATLQALSELVAEDACPAALIGSETERRVHDLGHRLEQQNLTIDSFLQITNQSPESLIATLREDAVKWVRTDLALRALAKAEALDPTDEEADEELVSTSLEMGVSAETLRTNIRESGRVVAFRAEVAKMKATKWLNEHVSYVDAQGNEISRELLETDQSLDENA